MCSAHDYLSKGCCKRRFVCPTQADARKIAELAAEIKAPVLGLSTARPTKAFR
jgi:hypothetical protein